MSFTQVALTGTIEASPGVALASATVTATLSGEMSDGVTVVTPLGVSARTAADGTFSLTVPANDDTTTTPTGRFYNITVQSQSGQVLDQFSVVVPHAAAPTVALYSLARMGTSGTTLTYGVVSFNARTGIVVLSKADVTGTGLAAADVGADPAGAAAAAQTAAQSFATSAVATETSRAEAAEALLAPKASPAFTGTPTAPTPVALDSTTKLATTAYVQGSLAAYVPLLGGAAPVAGPPTTSGTTVGQAQVDANGLMWVWNGNQWQLGGAGIELGYAEAAANYALTTAFAVPPGLTVPVNIPPGVDVEVECFCPWILNGATGSNATYVALALYEDSTLIKTALNPFVTANMSSEAGVRASYTPSSAGEHTFSVQAKQNGTATATIEGGLQSGLLVSPFLRVRSV